MTSKPTINGKPPSTAAVAAKAPPRDIDESLFIVNNCQPQGDFDADEVYSATVLSADAKFALEKGLALYEAHYNDIDYDKNDPKKSQVSNISNTTWMTNLLPVPDTLKIDTQPKKMLKMEMKGYKKMPFVGSKIQSLLNAVERRSMRRVTMGHHILIGGLVTFPGYDAVYDEIDDQRTVVAAAVENLKVDDVPKVASPNIDDVTLKTFPTFAIVHIERPDGTIEARHAVPELVTVTVAGYINLLNARIEQTKESTQEAKREQYVKMIQGYISKVEEWLASDPKKHSTSTVLTLYNYSIVSDDKLNESEAFHFVKGSAAKPFEEEKATANWHYILGHKNTTNIVAEFCAKTREMPQREGSTITQVASDKEQLVDPTIRAFTVMLKFAVPIVPPSYLLQWKITPAGKQAIVDGVDQGKKKRASKKAPTATPAKPKKTTKESVDENEEEEDEDDEDDGDAAADDGDDDEDDGEKKTKKKSKSPSVSVASGKPSKEEIGEKGTAEDTAKKIKAKNAKAKAPPSKEDGSRSADSEEDEDGEDAEEKAQPKSKKAKKATAVDDEEKQIASHSRKVSRAKLDMDEVASHAATFKAPKGDPAAAAVDTATASKKKKRVVDDADDAEVVDAAETNTTKKAKKEAVSEPATTAAAETGDAAAPDDMPIAFTSAFLPTDTPTRFFLRRRMLAKLADVQTDMLVAGLPEDEKFPVWLTFENETADDADKIDVPLTLSAETTTASDNLIAGAAWLGLDTLFIDLNDAVKARDAAEKAAEAAANAKRAAEEAAAAAAAAAAEEKRRKAEEAERKRKEKEAAAAEKKRKEEEAAAAAAEAAKAEIAAKKAAKAAVAATIVAKPKSEAATPTPAVAAGVSARAKLPGETTLAWMARLKTLSNK